jgi:catechol 2,3-dioxygenase-like lactoylglutathione lyase family enzyme
VPAIGIDHVQFSVPDLTASTTFLEERGWRLKFREPDFATTARPYFRAVGKSMAYLKRERAAIELIDGSERAGPASWTPLFSARLPGEVGAAVDVPRDAVEVRVPELGGRCLCVDVAERVVELGEVVLASCDPQGSASFLEWLGFRRDASADRLRLVFPPSIIGMGLAVTIVAGAPIERDHDVYVDDLGLSLVALLAKDLDADVAELRALGRRTTDVFDYRINGRAVSNVIVRGPGGELVELIRIGRAQ